MCWRGRCCPGSGFQCLAGPRKTFLPAVVDNSQICKRERGLQAVLTVPAPSAFYHLHPFPIRLALHHPSPGLGREGQLGVSWVVMRIGVGLSGRVQALTASPAPCSRPTSPARPRVVFWYLLSSYPSDAPFN